MAHSTKSGYVDRPQFETYSRKFAAFFQMERSDGIILVRMHHRGGSAKFDFAAHNAWGQAWHEIGNDPANEVMRIMSRSRPTSRKTRTARSKLPCSNPAISARRRSAR